MKVVVSAQGGGFGHLARAGGVVKELRKRGHEVAFFLPAHSFEVAQSVGVESRLLEYGTPWETVEETIADQEPDWMLIDAVPDGYFGTRPSPRWGRLALLARHSTREEKFGGAFEVAFRYEPLGYELACPVVDVEPILLAEPESGPREDKVLISLRGGAESRKCERAAVRACDRLDVAYEVSTTEKFPSRWSLYRAAVSHAGLSTYEIQQSGTPAVLIPRSKPTCNQRARALGEISQLEGCVFCDDSSKLTAAIASALNTAPRPSTRFRGAEQVANFLEASP